jgi:hypothetical protein
MPPPDETAPQARPWELADAKLLAHCRVETFIASGPGGQKRNKTSAAIRITHLATSISATAADSRSQRENRIHALRNLRHKLAMEIRHDLDPLAYAPPKWLAEYPGLHMNAKNPRYPALLAEVLDLLEAMQWSISQAAARLGVGTSALMRFLRDDPALWAEVNRKRISLGLPALRPR